MRMISASALLKKAAVFLSAAFFCVSVSWGQDKAPDRDRDHEAIFTAALENDLFSGEDDNYTNGVRFSFLSAENNLPDWLENSANALPFFSVEGYKRWQVEMGQNMYTPRDITVRPLQVRDRPYAGWLYGSVGLISDTGNQLDNLQLTLGIVGPGSGAAQTQDFVHHLIDTNDPQGWSTQLHNEPGLVLTYERKWRSMYEFSPGQWGVDVTPSLGAV